jgi:hypothetical protein
MLPAVSIPAETVFTDLSARLRQRVPKAESFADLLIIP